jgi:bisphosphoglycerate-dependent phosphoglycerate mutase
MANNSKKWKVDEEVYLRFLGDATVGDAESWTRTITINRQNECDIPPCILRDKSSLWDYMDYDDISKSKSYNLKKLSYTDERRMEFVADLWEYILKWLKENHNITISAHNLGCEEGYGQSFRRMPQMWIQPDFLIIEQSGGMDV